MKAVLFDMDGILIDTEKYLTVYKQKAMREAGYRLDLETAYKFRSCASVFAREQMKGIFGEDFPYDELRRRRQELMSDHIARFGIEKKPYVEETIKGHEKTWLSDGSRDGYSGRQGCALSGNGRI